VSFSRLAPTVVRADEPLGNYVSAFRGEVRLDCNVAAVDLASGEAEMYLRDPDGRIYGDSLAPFTAFMPGVELRAKDNAPAWALEELARRRALVDAGKAVKAFGQLIGGG